MTLACEQPLLFELHVRLAKSQAIRREGVWQKRRIAARLRAGAARACVLTWACSQLRMASIETIYLRIWRKSICKYYFLLMFQWEISSLFHHQRYLCSTRVKFSLGKKILVRPLSQQSETCLLKVGMSRASRVSSHWFPEEVNEFLFSELPFFFKW